MLIVLDPTANIKLEELRGAFATSDGISYIGQAAWDHLATMAGPTMARLLERYVHQPFQQLLQVVPAQLPDLLLQLTEQQIVFQIGDERLLIPRTSNMVLPTSTDELPEDVDDDAPTR